MLDDLPPERRREYKNAFEMFDKKKNGSILAKDLGNVLRALNIETNDEEISELINEIDSENKEEIDFEDFITLMNRHGKDKDKEKEVISAFKVFDKDNAGTIPIAELKQIMLTIGEQWGEDEIDDWLKDADTEGNGLINYEDFVKNMMGR